MKNKIDPLKHLNATSGWYMPAFFHMCLETEKPISNIPLQHMDKDVQSVFFHEYIHFLQDISTYAGLNNIYCISEYVKLVATRYATQNPFYVPVRLENNDYNVRLNDTLNRETAGGHCRHLKFEIYDTFISDFYNEDLKSQGIESVPIVWLLTSEGDLEFGRREIMESMAYILQRKCTNGTPVTYEYPYYAAEKTAQFLYPGNFSQDLDNILALCDIALLTSNPGNVFVCCVNKIKDGEWVIDKPEDIYDCFYSSNTKVGTCISTTSSHFVNLSTVVKQSLKDYICQPQIATYLHPWIDLVIDAGQEMRIKDRYFFLNLARGGDYLSNAQFQNLLKHVGSPIIENLNSDFCRFPSQPDFGDYFQYLMAIETLYNIFKTGCFQCQMKSFCEHSKTINPNVIVDAQCDTSPWNKISRINENCPVAFMFLHRKLAINSPTLRKS